MRFSLFCLALCSLFFFACGDSDDPSSDPNNLEPIPALLVPDEIASGASVVFDGSRSVDEDGYIEFWWFEPGDDTPTLRSASPQIVHVFSAPGAYEVKLIVIDNQGKKASISEIVQVR